MFEGVLNNPLKGFCSTLLQHKTNLLGSQDTEEAM